PDVSKGKDTSDGKDASNTSDATEGSDSPRMFEIQLTARATVNGREIVQRLPQRLQVTLVDGAEPHIRLTDARDGARELEVLEIRPGETISARVVVERNGTTSRIGFGKDDAGRNLPHGAFVDNVGLNGLLITEEQSEREF